MEACPESADGKEVEFEPPFGYKMQVHRDGEGKEKLTGDQGGDSESEKAFKYNDHEIVIAASDNSMKDQENCPYLDLEEMKVEHLSAFDYKDSGYMTDFNGEKELNSELSNSVRKIHTEQGDSCSGQKRIGSSVCVTHEFDDKMVEEEVEHGFKNKKKKTVHQDPCAFHTCKNLLPGKTLFKHAEESDINNFICIRENKTCFRTLCDCIWNRLQVLPRLFCMDGNAASNDGPTSSELTQDINTEHRHMILVQRDIQVQSQNQGSSESHTLGALTMDMESVAFSMFANLPHQPGIAMAHTSGEVTLKSLNQVSGREETSAKQSNELLRVIASGENADEKNPAKTSAAEEIFSRRQASEKCETIATKRREPVKHHAALPNSVRAIIIGPSGSEFKEHQQTPDIKSKINQDQDELNSEMNWYISKTWVTVSDQGSCKPHSYINSTNYICCIINISVYVLALEPRQNDVSSLVTETTPLLPPTVYHSIARQVDGQNVLTAASQTIDGHPSGRGSSNNRSQEPQRGMDDPSNSPACQCNDRDTGFTDVHLASGRVTEDASQDSGPTLPSTPIHESDLNITSMELLRTSDVSRMTPLAEARSQHSSVDTRCSDEEDGNGFQTDAGRHAVTEQAADGNPFQIDAARSTQNEQSRDVNGINKPTSPVNSHGKNGDTGSIKLHSIRSTDPGNGSTIEQTVHVPTRTTNQDESSANPVEMASMNLATGEIRNTKDEASGGGQNENRRELTSIQETDSAQPICPQYASNDQRMNSFQGWPARLRQRPEEMAECGFYYAGFNDCVHCFHCGVGIRQWMHEDDPWFEHAQWSPSCFYVRRIKGDGFVSSVMSTIAAMEAARKNTTGNDSSNNTKESANGKNKDMITETEETAIEQEPITNPDIFPAVMRQEFYDATICRICIDRKRSVIFLPCGHFGTCTCCSYFLQECPFCRRLIVKKIEIKDC